MSNLIRTYKPEPIRVCVYGQIGIGKTTFAAGFPSPYIVSVESGARGLGVPYTETDDYEDTMNCIDACLADPLCKTLVLDSCDALELMIWDKVCQDATTAIKKVDSIEKAGDFGAGLIRAYEIFCRVLSKLEKTDKNIVLIAHSRSSKFINPMGNDWHRVSLKMTRSGVSKCDPSEKIREWVDVLGFAHYDVNPAAQVSAKGKKVGVSKALSDTGESLASPRVLGTQYDACYDAKSRVPMPPKIAFESEDFLAWLDTRPTTPTKVAEKMRPLLTHERLEAFDKWFTETRPMAQMLKLYQKTLNG